MHVGLRCGDTCCIFWGTSFRTNILLEERGCSPSSTFTKLVHKGHCLHLRSVLCGHQSARSQHITTSSVYHFTFIFLILRDKIHIVLSQIHTWWCDISSMSQTRNEGQAGSAERRHMLINHRRERWLQRVGEVQAEDCWPSAIKDNSLSTRPLQSNL